MEDLGRDLNIDPAFFEDLKRGAVPDDRTIWAISNWLNIHAGRTNIHSTSRYNFEARTQLKDLPRKSGVIIPKGLETVLVAYNFGNERITQEDIDELVKFSNSLIKE